MKNEKFENICKYVIAYINDNVVNVINYDETLNEYDFIDMLHFMSIENKFVIMYNDEFNNDNMYRIIIEYNTDINNINVSYQYVNTEYGDCTDCVEYSVSFNAWLTDTLLTNIISFIEYTKTNNYMLLDYTRDI